MIIFFNYIEKWIQEYKLGFSVLDSSGLSIEGRRERRMDAFQRFSFR